MRSHLLKDLLMMSRSNSRVSLGLVAVSGLMLAACASSGTRSMDAGERMSARADSIAGRSAEWSAGQEDVRNGEKLLARGADSLADGEKDLRKAQENVRKAEKQIETALADRQLAEQMVLNGTAQMRRAEADYSDIRNAPTGIVPR